MDAHSFSQVLKKPFLLEDFSFSELQNLSERFPYASVISTLIALKAHRENDGSYEHYLSQAAIRAPDRKRLYHLIHSSPLNIDDVEDIENIGKEDFEDVELAKPSIIPAEIPKAVIPPGETAPTESESLIKVSISDEVKPVVVKKEEESVPLELPGIDEAMKALKSIKEKRQEEVIERYPEKTETAEPPLDAGHSFTEWLTLLKKPEGKSSEPPIIREIRESVAEEIQFSPASEPSEKEAAGISQRAEESLSDDMEWVTETLAKIYELQKKYDKAAEAYRMLSLKYPDKKAYFAQRIENLKKFRD